MLFGPPIKTCFIVPSALGTHHGVFSLNERLQQTLRTIESIRHFSKGARIILVETTSLLPQYRQIVAKSVDIYLYLAEDNILERAKRAGAKSLGDARALFLTARLLRTHPRLQPVLYETQIFYKLSARYCLNESFRNHATWGKFRFKRYRTWRSDGFYPYLVSTRLFGFCSSLVNDLQQIAESLAHSFLTTDIDIEHGMALLIDESRIFWESTLGVFGQTAGNGSFIDE